MKAWPFALIVCVLLPLVADASDLGPHPSRFRVSSVDVGSLRERLGMAASDARGAGVEISLPLPDGRLARFRVADSPMLGADLRRLHPELRTYRASGVDDPGLSAKIDLTLFGLRAIVFTPEGTALIDPLERGRTDQVMSYWARDDAASPFECSVEALSAAPPPAAVQSAGSQLRTYRFILMATGEYTQWVGGVPQALAEMTTSMNRVAAIFERDVAVRLEVVQLMPFPDPATDPYSFTLYNGLLSRNTPVVDSIFGSANYDIAQVINRQASTSYNGVAYSPSVCSVVKGGSVASAGDVNTTMFYKAMAHEIGHQLGAFHTQDRNCSRFSDTAYEVGSGVTVMSSVGGSCPPDFLPYPELFLHVASIEQMITLPTAGDCGTLAPTGNSPPVPSAGPDYTIPRATPFVLSGSASDPDAGDALTYCWEQFDKAPTSADPINGPLFRWRPPSSSPVRSMPALATVLSGVADPFEQLPLVDRLMHFRLTARDNHPGAGGHAWDEMVVTVSGAPFAVTFPNGGNTFNSGVPVAVTWTVGGGGVAASVNLLLSTDGGATWSLLAPGVPNDGSETVSFLTASTIATCRIKVEAVGNIFYDVSDADFTIVGAVTSTLLSLLEAASTPEGVVIRWRFTVPFDRVVVERADTRDGPWSHPEGVLSEESDATRFLDPTVSQDHTYYYRLLATARDGSTSTFGPIRAQTSGPPTALAIMVAAPNPAAGAMQVEYSVPRPGHVRLTVLDVQGREVTILVDRVQEAGRYVATWTGGTSRGRRAGLYFLRIESGGAVAVRTASVIR